MLSGALLLVAILFGGLTLVIVFLAVDDWLNRLASRIQLLPPTIDPAGDLQDFELEDYHGHD